MTDTKIYINKGEVEAIVFNMIISGKEDLAVWLVNNLKEYYDDKLTRTQKKAFEDLLRKHLI